MMSQVSHAVIERLKAAMPGYVVELFPDAPDRYAFKSARHALLVSYESSSYAAPDSLAPLSVERTGLVGVTLLTRSLTGERGVVASVEGIVKALFGWRPSRWVEDELVFLGASPMVPVRDAFVAEDNGLWRWVVEFSLRTTVVASTTPLSGPPFQGIGLTPAED